MRMSWFSSLRGRQRLKNKQKSLQASSLRVRQLERRRVLDGAATSVVVAAVVNVPAATPAAGQTTASTDQANASTATTVHATDAPLIVVTSPAPGGNSSTDNGFVAAIGAPGQGLANASPVVFGSDKQVNEGQLLDLSGSGAPPMAIFVDIDLSDTHTATIDWGDGSPMQAGTVFEGVGSGAVGGTHTYADNGNYAVTVTVVDSAGGTGATTFNVLVKNVAPTVTTANQTVDEGSLLNLTGTGANPALASFNDPGKLDTHTATVDWGDGSPLQNATVTESLGAGTLGGTHTYSDNGTYTVTVTVKDNDGGTTTSMFDVMVKNVAPFVDLSGPTVVNEGSPNTWTLGTVVDPGADTVTQYIIHWGDGNTDTFTPLQIAAMGHAVTHIYADGPSNPTITVDLVDEDGTHAAVDSLNVTVNNVAPFVDLTGPTNVNEGSATAWNLGPVVDPGADTVTQYIVHWGDGHTDTYTPVQIASMSGAIVHSYADGPHNYTISVDLTDEDGTHLAVDTLAITVNNVPPAVVLNAVSDINENGSAVLSGSYTDPGIQDAHSVTVSWGDPNYGASSTFTVNAIQNSVGTTTLHAGDTFNSADGAVLTVTAIDSATGKVSFSVKHQYLDDGVAPGNNTASDVSTIAVTVTDSDGQSGSNTTAVKVNDVAPTVAPAGAVVISENGVATLTGSYTDTGRLDAQLVTIDWDDPNNGTDSTFTVPALQNAGGMATLHVNDTFNSADGAVLKITAIDASTGTVSFSVQHQYLDDGVSPGNGTTPDVSNVTISVKDDDGQTGAGSAKITVTNVTPSVTLNSVGDIDENGVATLTGSYADSGLLDAHTVTVDWGDPNNATASTFSVGAIQNAAGMATLLVNDTFNSADGAVLTITAIDASTGTVSFSVQHQYSDDGLAPGNSTISDVNTIGVTVADDDGESGNNTTTVTVKNVKPTVTLGAVANVNESGIATLTGSYTDLGKLDAHTLTVNWNDPNNATASTFAISAIQNAAGTVTLHVNDTFNSADGAVLTISAIDATTGTVSFSVQHQYLDDGLAPGNSTISDTSSIVVTVADDDGQSGDNKSAVTVHNVAPTVALNPVADIDENGTATLSGSYTDIGRLDAHTMTVTWGDPNNAATSVFAVTALENAAGTATLHVNDMFNSADGAVLTITAIDATTGMVSFSVQHQYLDDGLALGNNTISDVSTIGATIADDDGQSATTSTTLTIHNVASTVLLDAVTDINENGIATLTGSYTDIGKLDAHTISVTWGDPNNAAVSSFSIGAIQNAAGNVTLHVNDTFNSADGAVLTITAIDATTGTVSFSVQHQYLDDGLALGNNTISDASTIGMTVADDDAQSGSKTTTVTVHNVTPSVTLNSVSDIIENGTATLSGSYTDIGTLDGHTLTVNWGDPNNSNASAFTISALQNAAGVATLHVNDTFNSVDGAVLTITAIDATTGTVTFSVQHKYLDDGLALGNNTISDVSTIGVTVADDDNQSGSNTTSVTVYNVTPTVTLNSVSDINENGTATLTGSYTDVGKLDAHMLSVHWGDPNNAAASTFSINAIQNAAGAATLVVGNTFNSADGAVLTITAIDTATGTVTFSVQHQYLDDGLALGNNTIADVSTIGVTVADDDGQSNNIITTVTVHNVAPTVALNSVTDINENGSTTLTGSYIDIGRLDAHTVTITWGDPNNAATSMFAVSAIQNAAGTATLHVNDTFTSSDGAVLTITAIDTTTGQVSFLVQHQYLDDGLALGNNTINDTSTISVTVADDDALSGDNTTTVTVHNVAPAVALNPVVAISENGLATLTGSYTDIGTLDAHTLTINWDDLNSTAASTFAVNAIANATGTATLSVGDTFISSTDSAVLTITAIDAATGTVSFSLQHQYLDDGLAPGNGTISDVSTIGVTVADDDAQDGNNTTTVTVNNVAPTILNLTSDSIDEGHVATISMGVGDPGTLDVFTVNVDWRDGSTATIGGFGATDATGTIGATNYSWTAATRQLTVTHLYADNAEYPVVVRLADDDMTANFGGAPSTANYVQQTTLVSVANLAPTLAGTSNLAVDEGSPVSLVGLGVHIEDQGFDNPSNQTAPPIGSLTTEEFTAFSINWGDGFTTTPVNVVNRVSGAPTSSTTATLTTADFLHADHHYADDGTYTVTVRMADDNMGAFSNPALFTTGVAGVDYVDRQFTITVKNVTPTLAVTSVVSTQQTGASGVTTTPITPASTITINESGTVSLSASFTDPGFSLDPNPSAPAGTSFPRNEIFRYYINWGDNRETIGEGTAADVAAILNGGPGVATSSAFDTSGMVHTYADDGTYTVTVRLADDNMGAFNDTSKFATGVGVGFGTDNGGDFVETKFTVVVNNIAPTFVPQPGGANVVGTQVSSEGFTTVNVAFNDPGFDNTANLNAAVPPAITDTLHETFTHVIDWGDGTVDAVHTYTDNSAAHDVTITRTGPDGTHTTTLSGVGGPTNQALTLVSSQDINNPGAVAQNFTFSVDWGDGNVQTITLLLKAPGAPTLNGLTTVGILARTSGNVGIATTGSFEITHKYLGPPDPLNPTADIIITASVVDDNNASVTDFTTITNPGINTFNVAIDTTPNVPKLALLVQQPPPVILTQPSPAPGSLQPVVARVVSNELAATSDRYLELDVISPDGETIARYRLSDEALVDLRGLFATLPDGRYKIYLKHTDNNSSRLVMDVFVRRGRVIDPSDDSEGTRDRPPTNESSQPGSVKQNNNLKNIDQPNGPPQQPIPLKNNPLLKPLPDSKTGAAVESAAPVIELVGAPVQSESLVSTEAQRLPTGSLMRWALPLAGLGLVACRESWSARVGAVLESDDHDAWKRLRQAGRLGRITGKTGSILNVIPEMQSATTNDAS